ncbi:MAG: HEPN domain-containing protein [Clostridiales Family XIII bacterium]|nr:HEPN domain-containing protein [Clostridia bacterium]MDY3010097.1 HEPN domain-containing protein [Clostridiales Family XIII bacterium]
MHDDLAVTLAKYRLDRSKELIMDARRLYEAASYESGNNRAYYAIFYAMRAIIALDGVDFKKHSGVIQYFQREYVKTGKFKREYSQIIMEANEIRNASDYDDFYIASREETKKQIDGAEKFYTAVKVYLEEIF